MATPARTGLNDMTKDKISKIINRLFELEKWGAARRLLEKDLKEDPTNHWVLTQLGATLYEQRRYRAALKLFQKSRAIVPGCPLTLWHLAGALDALG